MFRWESDSDKDKDMLALMTDGRIIFSLSRNSFRDVEATLISKSAAIRSVNRKQTEQAPDLDFEGGRCLALT